MSEAADKWVQKAREIVAKRFEEENHKLHMGILRGDMDDVMPKIQAIARALMAAADAATERAASWHDNQAVGIEMSSKRVNGKMMTRKPLWHRQCASAIRKGNNHD